MILVAAAGAPPSAEHAASGLKWWRLSTFSFDSPAGYIR
jgi:hypothetical protein